MGTMKTIPWRMTWKKQRNLTIFLAQICMDKRAKHQFMRRTMKRTFNAIPFDVSHRLHRCRHWQPRQITTKRKLMRSSEEHLVAALSSNNTIKLALSHTSLQRQFQPYNKQRHQPNLNCKRLKVFMFRYKMRNCTFRSTLILFGLLNSGFFTFLFLDLFKKMYLLPSF